MQITINDDVLRRAAEEMAEISLEDALGEQT